MRAEEQARCGDLAKDLPRGRPNLAPQIQDVPNGGDRTPTPQHPNYPKALDAGRGGAELSEVRNQGQSVAPPGAWPGAVLHPAGAEAEGIT